MTSEAAMRPAPRARWAQAIHRRLTEAGAESGAAWISVVTPATPPEEILSAAAVSPSLCWLTSDGDGWTGIGALRSIPYGGATEAAEVSARLMELLGELEAAATGEGPRPAPIAGGGFAFDSRVSGDPLWREFGPGLLTVPRWLYRRSGAEGTLSIALSGEEEPEDLERLDRELIGIEAAIGAGARASISPPDTSERRDLDPERWGEMVRRTVTRIHRGGLEKVVLARRTQIELEAPADPGLVLRRLRRGATQGTCFALRLGSRSFVAASPERLVRRERGRISTEAVAGSAAREADLRTPKNLLEHELTVRGIREALAPWCTRLTLPSRPRLLTLRDVLHLVTSIEGRQTREGSVLEVAAALHPTPAVGAVPRDPGMDWIREMEPVPRGWYAGAVGWLDARGDGEFRVALRSGLLEGRRAWIYAGAGIVADSRPGEEYRETSLKLQPMLSALGATR